MNVKWWFSTDNNKVNIFFKFVDNKCTVCISVLSVLWLFFFPSHTGGTDVLSWKLVGAESSQYITGIALELTNMTTKTPVYYVSMKAENGAGILSTQAVTSTPIIVVPEDKAGKISMQVIVHVSSNSENKWRGRWWFVSLSASSLMWDFFWHTVNPLLFP